MKLGVRPGSPFHLTECFGPVLGVMRAEHLDQAIAWQNQVPFGLTAGLAALDPAEISYWRQEVQAGNLYVNRHTTGAVVGRQPFGGWKRSVVGPAAKTGGPHYVASLGRWKSRNRREPAGFAAALAQAVREGLSPSDPAGLSAEGNVVRYPLVGRVLLRAGSGTDEEDARAAVSVSGALGLSIDISTARPLSGIDDGVIESDGELAARLSRISVDKIRVLGSWEPTLRLAAMDCGHWWDDVPMSTDPSAEALRWVREQTVTETRHRHGDVVSRRPGLRAVR